MSALVQSCLLSLSLLVVIEGCQELFQGGPTAGPPPAPDLPAPVGSRTGLNVFNDTTSTVRERDRFSQLFDPNRLVTVSGPVVDIEVASRPEDDNLLLVELNVRGDFVVASLAPVDFLERNDVSVRVSSVLEITGSPAEIGGRRYIVVSRLRLRDKRLRLRQEDGRPRWRTRAPGST